MAIRTIITVLCAVGLYASLFMLRKAIRASRGELTEPSVVHSPRARLFGGVPNSAIGVVYYPALALTAWFASTPVAFAAMFAAAIAAAITSLVLAYSLIYVTRMPCPFCWTSHAVNWILAASTFALLLHPN